jgi:hypothetical protein
MSRPFTTEVGAPSFPQLHRGKGGKAHCPKPGSVPANADVAMRSYRFRAVYLTSSTPKGCGRSGLINQDFDHAG